jgi:hypothetical protein
MGKSRTIIRSKDIFEAKLNRRYNQSGLKKTGKPTNEFSLPFFTKGWR